MLRLGRSLADRRYIVTDVGRHCIYVVGIPEVVPRRELPAGKLFASSREQANKTVRTIIRSSTETLAAKVSCRRFIRLTWLTWM